MRIFPAWDMAVRSLRFCWENRGLLMRFAIVPFVAALISQLVSAIYGARDSAMPFTLTVPIVVIGGVTYIPFLVTWYHLATRGADAIMDRPVFGWSRRESRVLLWELALLALLGAGIAIMVALGYAIMSVAESEDAFLLALAVLTIITIVAIGYFGMRLSLTLTLAALDEPTGLHVSWRMTQGIGWKLVGSGVLITLGIMMPIAISYPVLFVIALLVGDPEEARRTMLYVFVPISAAANVFSVAAIATLSGFTYRWLNEPEMPVETAVEPAAG